MFHKKKFSNYWFDTGTPSFLVKTIEHTGFDFRNMSDGIGAMEDDFMSYRSENLEPIPLFYQSGYLTIKSFDPDFGLYTLSFPNHEVKYSFLNCLMPMYTGIDQSSSSFSIVDFVKSIKDGDAKFFIDKLKSLISSIPYDSSKNADKLASYEHTYQTALYLIFTLCGQYLKTEVHMIGGRADAILETADKIYIFEFKIKGNGTADDAINQILTNGYDKPYRVSAKNIILIGIVFSPESRTISEYKVV